jgi:hypothetical protein
MTTSQRFISSADPALVKTLASLVPDIADRLEEAAGEPMAFLLFAGNKSGELGISIASNHDPREMIAALMLWIERIEDGLATHMHQTRN